MSANTKLASAVVRALSLKLGEKMNEIYDEDLVEAVIRQHQSNYPGSWQEWKHEDMLQGMTKMMLKAVRSEETAPARIVLFCD